MASDPREGRDKPRGGRGTVRNNDRLGGLNGRALGSSNADWGTADPRWVAGVIVACCRRGMAVTFGYSRDGGAYSLTILDGGHPTKLYFNGDAILDDELEKVYHYIDALPE